MGTVKVTNIEPIADNGTLTIGNSGDTIALTSGAKTSGFGKVGQVVMDTTFPALSTTSTSFVDGGLSVNITPTSTSSKILVQFNTQIQSGANETVAVGIFRDSTNITASFGSFAGYSASGTQTSGGAGIVLDSPSTTSQITYKVRFRSFTGTQVFLSSSNNTRTLIAMEILD